MLAYDKEVDIVNPTHVELAPPTVVACHPKGEDKGSAGSVKTENPCVRISS